ncbi:unnamed protein product, partial [Heterosigma akashiwo]
AVPWVILIWVCGAFLLHFLAHTSGLDLSFSQHLAVMGYCIVPLLLVIFLAILLKPRGFLLFLFQALGVLWSTKSALGSLVKDPMMIHRSRQWTLIYPTLLFYLFLVSLYAPSSPYYYQSGNQIFHEDHTDGEGSSLRGEGATAASYVSNTDNNFDSRNN